MLRQEIEGAVDRDRGDPPPRPAQALRDVVGAERLAGFRHDPQHVPAQARELQVALAAQALGPFDHVPAAAARAVVPARVMMTVLRHGARPD
ncbi:hypothetical protein MOX02_21390 [Methylobacterium oxalidis]|uniref:Uncharacterized protein n=1 Tax=Methylobacterium oxalidis TaxID=944322 RepID=A0A512J2C2_9HYPH|nr:hypothetical protein MOX02_21390 [Methylobacterium oxalidis]GLS65070.1 hypothetical protein GCM10007888_34510 [Methylobacterium oxalidis]